MRSTPPPPAPRPPPPPRLFPARALDRALHDFTVRVACFDRAPSGVVLEMQRLMSGDRLSRPRDALEWPGLGDDAVAAHRDHPSWDRVAAREVSHPSVRTGSGGQQGLDDRVLSRGGLYPVFQCPPPRRFWAWAC